MSETEPAIVAMSAWEGGSRVEPPHATSTKHAATTPAAATARRLCACVRAMYKLLHRHYLNGSVTSQSASTREESRRAVLDDLFQTHETVCVRHSGVRPRL